MNKSIIKLALETLLEQLVCSDTDTDNLTKQRYVEDELFRLNHRVTSSDFARWLQFTMDMEAEEMFGEFGYNTLTEVQQREILMELYERELIE